MMITIIYSVEEKDFGVEKEEEYEQRQNGENMVFYFLLRF